jgi:hypothetical protein
LVTAFLPSARPQAYFDGITIEVEGVVVIAELPRPSLAVITRAPWRRVKKAHTHRMTTVSLLVKPTKNKMCTPSHINHARKPLHLNHPIIATARECPIVAIVPLSQYENAPR